MHSPSSTFYALLLCLLVFTTASALRSPATEQPSAAEISAAAEALQHDPNLGEKKTVRSLHWVKSKESDKPASASSNLWLLDLFRYLSQFSRIAIWILGAFAVALCGIWILRVLRFRGADAPKIKLTPVLHLQDMDVRPSSLPNDIGSSARALLDAGRMREALSLLYRGALSRVIHGHSVDIRESFTEAEVLAAVRRQINEPASQYFSKLLGLWQREVYARDRPAVDLVATLCLEFAPALERGP